MNCRFFGGGGEAVNGGRGVWAHPWMVGCVFSPSLRCSGSRMIRSVFMSVSHYQDWVKGTNAKSD